MTKDLLRMCSECGRIKINNRWIGRGDPNYQREVSTALHITDAYCPRHLYNNQLQRQLAERRRNKVISR